MNVFSGIDLNILSAWLTQAQTDYNDVVTGRKVLSLGTGDKRITFTAADPDKLNRYIADLQSAIAALTGTRNRRKGVYLVGGKGL